MDFVLVDTLLKALCSGELETECSYPKCSDDAYSIVYDEGHLRVTQQNKHLCTLTIIEDKW